ncbi:MAG: hypothetical protein ACR2O1_14415, partial [Boseongicola sp.]
LCPQSSHSNRPLVPLCSERQLRPQSSHSTGHTALPAANDCFEPEADGHPFSFVEAFREGGSNGFDDLHSKPSFKRTVNQSNPVNDGASQCIVVTTLFPQR